ncbi:MAG: hypothetical protein HYV20_11480 [Gemmatimonadetes bacterium]|nr:hypothetical protein [Gemmatimonadota bacterium]
MPPHVDEVKQRALPCGMDSPEPPATERRARPRTSRDNLATSVVQMILRDPVAAGDMLEQDIVSGGDPQVVLGLLDAAEAIFQLRGVDAGAKLTALRQRLKRYAG